MPQLVTISAMLPARGVLPGMAIAYDVSTSLFGGTAPAANDWLIDRTGSDLVPAYSMMISCVVGLMALRLVTEIVGCSLRGRQVPGTTRPPVLNAPRRSQVSVAR